MAKGNKWFLGHTYHSREGLFKIPFKYRKEFMGSNQDKWVEKKKWLQFIKWKKAKGII